MICITICPNRILIEYIFDLSMKELVFSTDRFSCDGKTQNFRLLMISLSMSCTNLIPLQFSHAYAHFSFIKPFYRNFCTSQTRNLKVFLIFAVPMIKRSPMFITVSNQLPSSS